MANKLLRDNEPSGRGTPASEATDGRGRKGKKKGAPPKAVVEYELPAGSKRKRGIKSNSLTPSLVDDEDDEPEVVSISFIISLMATRLRSNSNKNEENVDLPPAAVRALPLP